MADNDLTRRAHNFKDLTGKRFGSLVVTGFGEKRGKVAYWNVLCDCGNNNLVAGNNLSSGRTLRCGQRCSTRIDPRMKDETGNVYGKLTVLWYAGKSLKSKSGSYWRCRCECGNEVDVVGVTLRSGKTQSCSAGCGHTTHGQTTNAANRKTPEYSCWLDMRSRCHNPSDPGFINYGGRGVTVCDKWRDSFEAFFADMGSRPSKSHSIGRIDNDAGYCKENCRWETPEQQHNNKRTSHRLTYNGETLTIKQWSKRLGIHENTLSNRIYCGWSVEKAITTPVNKYQKRCKHY